MKRVIPLVFLCAFSIFSFAQTLVNQTIADTLGRPSQIYQYAKLQPGGGGTFAVLANKYDTDPNNADDNFFLAKYSVGTGFVAGFDLHALHSGWDFGTNLCIKGSYVYAVGFTTDSILNLDNR